MTIVLNGNMNESSSKDGKGFYPNTELGIDLKLMTKEPGRMAVGEFLDGAITQDGEDHFTFVQNDSEKKMLKVVQRNPHVYEGTFINVNRKKDGTLYPTFSIFFSESFCTKVKWSSPSCVMAPSRNSPSFLPSNLSTVLITTLMISMFFH